MEIRRETLEAVIEEVLREKLAQMGEGPKECAGGLKKVSLPKVGVTEQDRLDTGNSAHRVYTQDLFTLEESPRLGCGIMEMEQTTFDWTLNYDEIDYVISGSLTIKGPQGSVTAGPGEIILIPKGSAIQFSVPEKARFLYVTYPADWADQK